MRKKFSFCILLLLVNLAAMAQMDPLYTNYMLAQTITNPAFVGKGEEVNALFVNRIMFAGFGDGKPETSFFGVDMPVNILGYPSGLGLLVKKDAIGYQDEVDVEFDYSYHRKLENGTLGFGIVGGFYNYHIDIDAYVPSSTEYTSTYQMTESDDLVPDETTSMTFSVGLGMYYETTKYYLGLSANHLNQAEIKESTDEQMVFAYYPVNCYLTGGYNIEMPDPLFDLRSSFLLRTDLASYELDVNGNMHYKDKYWGGLGFRVSPNSFDAVTILLGAELMNGLRVGYSFDLVTTAMIGNSFSSHEVIVNYSFSLKTKRDQKYKSVRYL